MITVINIVIIVSVFLSFINIRGSQQKDAS